MDKDKNRDSKEIGSSLKLLVKTSFIVFMGVFISKIIGYIYRIVVARGFDPEIYGAFSLAMVVSGLFGAVFSFGFSDGLLRYVALYRGRKEIGKARYLFQKVSKILIITGIIATVLMFALSGTIATQIFHNEKITIFLQLFALTLIFSILTGPLMSTIRAFEKIGWHSFITNILQNVIKLLAVILLIYLGFQSKSIGFSYLIASFLTFLTAYFVCKRAIPQISGKFKISKNQKKKIFNNFYSYSWPFVVLSLSAYVMTWIDSVMVGFYKTVYDVGIYNVAVTIAGLFLIAPMLFMQLLFPLLAKELGKKKQSVAGEISKQVGKWIFMLNLPLLFIVLVFPGVIINILFGSEYLGAINSLRIISIGLFFLQQAVISRDIVSSSGKSRIILFDYIVVSLFNTVLNFLFVPVFGINGAAFSTMLSYFVLGILYFVQAKKEAGVIPARRKMLGVLVSSLIPGIILIFLSKNLPGNLLVLALSGILFVLLYVCLIFLTRSLDRNDYMIIKSLWVKVRDSIGMHAQNQSVIQND